MSLTNDIPTKLRVPSQLALDAKTVVTSLSQLQTLGANNNLAYTYYKGMTVLCSENLNVYKWRPVEVGETGGTLASNFTYPNGIVSEDGVDYSNITYNFFKETVLTAENFSEFVQLRNIGEGVGLYKDNILIGDTKYFNLKSLYSNDIVIEESEDGNTVWLKLSKGSGGIPTLTANQDYVPNYNDFLNYYNNTYIPEGGTPLEIGDSFNYVGEGNISKPYTDTRVFIFGEPLTAPTVLNNTSIQNLLNAYVGTGDTLLPQKSGNKLLVDTSVTYYTFPGDFNYSNLDLHLNANVNCTTTGYLLDMDNPANFNADNAIWKITIGEDYVLDTSGSLGFRNSGNTSSTPPSYSTGRIGLFLGRGLVYNAYNGPDVLTRYILTGDGNNNDDGLHFQVKCRMQAMYQGIYFCKNKMRIDFYNQIISGVYLGSVNIALKAFHMTGGQIRFYEKGAISVSSETSGRTYGLTFAPVDQGIGYCSLYLQSTQIEGNCNYLFARLNNELVSLSSYNSPSGYGFSTTLPGSLVPVNGLFQNLGATKWDVDFKNNTFSYTGIDFDKVDFTLGNSISCMNFIGNYIVESLVRHPYRRDGGSNTLGNLFLPKYSKFINMNGSMVESDWYVDIML